MKKSLILFLMLSCSVGAKAQFGIGGQVNWSKYFSSGPSFIGFGANGSIVVGDEYPVRLSVNYGLPKSTSETTYGSALSSTTSPSQIQVTYEEKISMLNFWLDVQKYFGDGDYEDGGLYGLVGVGYTSAGVKYTVGSYDATRYDVGTFEDTNIGQLGIRGALGYDKGLDFGNLFGEFGLNLSANQANDQTIEVNLPSFMFVNVGIRHWLD